MRRRVKTYGGLIRMMAVGALLSSLLASCAPSDLPAARNVNIPTPTVAEERREAVNERPDPVLYLPLGEDVLIPEMDGGDPLPSEQVGPFELRAETLAGALQLILSDYDISLAFETDLGLTRTVTVANLRGSLGQVIRRVCGLADLYCAYEDGLLVVKETQLFTVKIPPINQDQAFMQNVGTGLAAIIGAEPVIDSSTRTLIYRTTQRNAEMAERYFQRMRTSTALIVFETYIWEVLLSGGNSSGINWSAIDTFGKFVSNISVTGQVGADFTNPISIGLPTTQGANGGPFTPSDVFNFLSNYGAVKTISQPQLTVLSGSQARLRAADTTNYVAEISETIDNGQSTTSVSTSQADSGFTLTIGSAWDNSTVYANIEIQLTDVQEIENFAFSSDSGGSEKGGSSTIVQLPRTTERELSTQVRIRPGDSLLIAGLVRENDNYNSSGPGFMRPLVADSRTATTENLELVFLLRPRVVVFTSPHDQQRGITRKTKSAPETASEQGGISVGAPTISTAIPLPEDGPSYRNLPAATQAGGTISPASDIMDISEGGAPPVSLMPPSMPAGASSGGSSSDMPLGSLSSDLLNPGSLSSERE